MERYKWGLLSIGVGIVIFVLSIVKIKKNNKIIKNGTLVKGVLVNYKEQEVDHGDDRGAGVSFSVGNSTITNQYSYQTIYAGVYEYVVNGFKYYICDESYSSIKKPLGSTKDIYYMNDNPESAVIKSKGASILPIFASIVFIVVGILAFIIK